MDDFVNSNPNGGAYETIEERSGPPLDYIQEKFAENLRSIRLIWKYAEADHLLVDENNDPDLRTKHIAYIGFDTGVRGFLALSNMLSLHKGKQGLDELKNMSCEEFDSWLDMVIREGSVTG